MFIVYATGTPSYLEFHVSHNRREIPQHATAYAICKGGRCNELFDERTFNALTDGEYYGFQAAVNLAHRLETRLERRARNRNPFYRALRWLFAPLCGKPVMDNLSNG